MNNAHPKILIVDDIPENLFVLEQILKNLETQIIRANSGNEALAQVLDHDFALIILDIQMPEMDGFEVAEILKSDERSANIPIIFVTAIDRDNSNEHKGYDTGAVDFIFKPINKFILISKVKVFLELHRIRSGLEEIVSDRTRALQKSNDALKAQMELNEEATREIEKGRAYLSKVIDVIPSSLITVDGDGNITDMNTRARELSGMDLDAARGMPIIECFPFFHPLGKLVNDAMASEKAEEKRRIPTYIKGLLIISNFAVYPFRFNATQGAVIRVDDITEQAKKDERMIQSEKMLSMGGIAAGMAHEINNPLAGIIQSVQVIRNRIHKKMPANQEAAKQCGLSLDALEAYFEERGINRMIEAIQQSGNRAACIVEDILSFTRKSEGGKIVENIETILEQSIKLALNEYRLQNDLSQKNRSITVEKNIEKDLPPVPCQAGKIQQALLNILKNSLQAMAQKSYGANEKSTLSCTLKTIDTQRIRIEISDNGPGIDPEIQKRIFEPFFTTKSTGSGLGLSLSYFIVTEDHGGELTLTSNEKEGATFIIDLPLTSNENRLK